MVYTLPIDGKVEQEMSVEPKYPGILYHLENLHVAWRRAIMYKSQESLEQGPHLCSYWEPFPVL